MGLGPGGNLLRKYALCLLIALAALVASIAAHADSAPQPIPADGKCAVPVDPNWTKQEQFVWLNVCAGKEADFNKEPGYGGDLDPKSATLPDSRILRSLFLENILLKDTYRSALKRQGVRIIGARFTGTVDLRNAELQHDLWLDESLLENGVDLGGVKTSRRITFDGTKIVGRFYGAEVRIDEDLSMRQTEFSMRQTEFLDFSLFVLAGAHIGGELDLRGSTVMGSLDMYRISVDRDLLMSDNAQFQELLLAEAQIGGRLDLSSSTVTERLNMYGTRVDRDVFMRDTQFKEIDLGGAHIGGEIDLSRSLVVGQLNMYGTRVDRDVLMQDGAQFKEIDFGGANIGGQIDLSGSSVTDRLNMYGTRVDRDVFVRQAQIKEINLGGARIGGQLNLSASTVTGRLEGAYANIEEDVILGEGAAFADEINLHSAKFGQDLELSDGIFGKDVDLTGAQIGGSLGLSATQWTGNATLDLTDAVAGEINLLENWPENYNLNGFSYRSVSKLFESFSLQRAESWLGKPAYTPPPYQQLANFLQAKGLIRQATEIRFAGKEQERRVASGLNRVWLVLLKYSIGFGYHLEYAFGWALGFVLLGWAVLYYTGQRTKHGITLGLAYSLDMLLPAVQLRKKHYDIDLDPWPRRYFYAHRIVGVILALFLVAGISGLTK